MRFRPGTPVAADGLQAEGLLVVDPGDGAPGPLLRRHRPGRRARPCTPRSRATASSSAPRARSTISEHADGGEAALAAYGDALAAPSALAAAAPPTVWCSWYRYFEEVTAADVAREPRARSTSTTCRVDVVQVDDGWSPGLGEGLRPADRFGSLPGLVDDDPVVRPAGRHLAGAVPGRRATPRWPASTRTGWSGRPGATGARTWSGSTSPTPASATCSPTRSRGWSTSASTTSSSTSCTPARCPVAGTTDVTGVAAYRSGLALVREVVGPDVYLVGCGAPLLPSVGLVDAMRVSPDTFHEGGEDGSTGLRGLMPLAARAWQQGRLWVNDPDCVVARPSYAQRERWADAARTLRRAALVLRPGRRARRLGAGRRSASCWPTAAPPTPFPPDGVARGAPRSPQARARVSDRADAGGADRAATSSCSTPTTHDAVCRRLVGAGRGVRRPGCAAATSRRRPTAPPA